jgi:hypothetical protein
MERWPPKFYRPQRDESDWTSQADRSDALMTGDQSRTLSIGERVRWGVTTTDLGTVVATSWSEVTIDWDDGHSTSIQHNDMAQVERVPVNLV